jgi:hypothetical protein
MRSERCTYLRALAGWPYSKGIDAPAPECCTAAIAAHSFPELIMDDVVDRILNTYQLMRPLDPERILDSRRKITRYIESLASAGQSDAQQLAMYGLAYLKEMHEGRDPRFTGC